MLLSEGGVAVDVVLVRYLRQDLSVKACSLLATRCSYVWGFYVEPICSSVDSGCDDDLGGAALDGVIGLDDAKRVLVCPFSR